MDLYARLGFAAARLKAGTNLPMINSVASLAFEIHHAAGAYVLPPNPKRRRFADNFRAEIKNHLTAREHESDPEPPFEQWDRGRSLTARLVERSRVVLYRRRVSRIWKSRLSWPNRRPPKGEGASCKPDWRGTLHVRDALESQQSQS